VLNLTALVGPSGVLGVVFQFKVLGVVVQ